MKLYVTRHGETVINAQHKVSGRGDVPLTDRGREQADALARQTLNTEIDLIIASPLTRAWETGLAVARAKGIEMIAEPRLMELDYGRFDMVSIDDSEFLQVKRSFTRRMGGGESILQAAARIYPCLEEIRQRYPKRCPLIVCHGTVCRVIHSYFHDLTDAEFWSSIPANCQLREYEF
ncbi:MAG: histidine phosphatase family protein [Oscillospiraceae bacterium]|nr:histidine phosphatase family protein [Oscillospiraceae bacterium]